MFILIKNKPYYVPYGENYYIPCEISALGFRTAGEKTAVKPTDNFEILTESEVKARLQIRKVDSWNVNTNRVEQISNKTVSSITAAAAVKTAK